jgi:hypothetical protein
MSGVQYSESTTSRFLLQLLHIPRFMDFYQFNLLPDTGTRLSADGEALFLGRHVVSICDCFAQAKHMRGTR